MSPYLWGFVSLLTFALALSGRLDLNAAKWVLALAWSLSTFSLYRFAPILHQPLVPRLLWTMLGASVMGLLLVWLAGWMSVRPNAFQPITQANPPDFKITLLGSNVFIPDQDPILTGIALEVRIRNSGGESIATDWALTITPIGGQPIRGQLTKPPESLTLKGVNTSRTIKLRQDDFSLERQAMSSPLKPNDPSIQSQILFYAPLPKAEVMAPDTVLTLTVCDFAGHTFSANQRMGDWLSR